MSEILCRWLNNDVQLSKNIDTNNFAECFSNGYLLGELLNRYGLQNDFDLFSKGSASEARLINFSRLEPTLSLLDIKFDSNMAKEIMAERPGMATRLLYQLFIALGKKSKTNLTGLAMETMRPAAPARLGLIKSDMYKERLKTLVPRQIDLDFDELLMKYNMKQKEQEENAMKTRREEEEKIKRYQQTLRQQGLDRSRQIREKQEDVMQKIKEATVKIPKPPEKMRNGKTAKELMKEREVQSVYKKIDDFEKTLRNASRASSQTSDQIRDIDADIEAYLNDSPTKQTKIAELIKPEENNDYIMKIRCRLNEDEQARKEREKRRRHVLIEQMKAHEEQQEYVREDILVNRLMRQSQMERRIVSQLLHVRHEKEIIKQNRLEREQQIAERRLQDFQDALEREAEMCRQAKIEYAADVKRNKELHESIAKQRALKKYEKHYGLCKVIIADIVDFACKIAEYRDLTEKKLPPKIVRDWKILFLNSKPLYDQLITKLSDEELQAINVEESKQSLLDEEDFIEYKTLVGEWLYENDHQIQPIENNILGFVLSRLNDLLFPPTPPPPAPEFPVFPIKACVLGKLFAGKSTAVRQLVSNHRIELLDVNFLLQEALTAWNDQEMIEIINSKTPPKPQLTVNCPSDDVLVPNSENQVKQEPTTEEADEKNVKLTADVNRLEEVTTVTMNTVQNDDIHSVASDMETERIEMHLTERAKLGEKVSDCLKKGQTVPDSLLVEILVTYIQNIPDGTGWVLDNFPTTLQQAKILEKSLTGYSPGSSPRKSFTKDTGKKGKKSKLAQDPSPPPEVKPLKSGLDVVVLFDIDDEEVLKRTEGRSFDPKTGEEYHEEFHPPPQGCYTGLQSKTKIQPLIDSANEREQAQIRLITFQDNWPKLEKWFNKFNILTKLSANQSESMVSAQLQEILDETLQKKAKPVEEVQEIIPQNTSNEAQSKLSTPQEVEQATLVVVDEPRDVAPAESKDLTKDCVEQQKKKKIQKENLTTPNGKAKGKKGRSPSPSKRTSSTASNASQRSRSRLLHKKESVHPPLEDTLCVVEEPPKPPSPPPGSEKWVYVNQPLDEEFANILLDNWEIIEETYIKMCKHVFRCIRHVNENVYQYFYSIRKSFVEFLRRPDDKQLYVTQWQKDYNKFPEDLRSDDESKAELHQRVDDLCDHLWDICDVRKEEAEAERLVIIQERWLEDHIGLLINHYISLIQTEADRYQQTCRMLRDYYVAMEGGTGPVKAKLISEGLPSFTRIPLVDLPPSQPPQVLTIDAIEGGELVRSPSQLASSTSTNAKQSKTPDPLEGKKTGRIPLVSREVLPVGNNSPIRNERKKTPKKERTNSSEEKLDSPAQLADHDEKLLHDAVVSALQVVDIQCQADLADEESDALYRAGNDANSHELKMKPSMRDKKAGKKTGKDKKGSSKSRSHLQEPATAQPSPIEGISEEEKEKIKLHENIKKEYKAAVQIEGSGLKTRVEAIRLHGTHVIKKLKAKAETTFADMDNWLGKRFLEEIKCISEMTERMKQAIENEQKLQELSVLEDVKFFIDENLHVFPTPLPPPLEPPTEQNMADYFTCKQLHALRRQFFEIAPFGLINIKSFVYIMHDLPSASVGLEALPEKWTNLTLEQLENIALMFAINNEDLGWKQFLLSVATPYPMPSKDDLFEALIKFTCADSDHFNFITLDNYMQTKIWLDGRVNQLDETVAEPQVYDRNMSLKLLFFDMFSEGKETSEEKVLDYVNMLLYFVSSDDALDAIVTALGLCCKQRIPLGFSLTHHRSADRCDTPENNSDESGEQKNQDKSLVEEGGKDEREDKERPEVPASNILTEFDLYVDINIWIEVFLHGKSGHGGNHRFSQNDAKRVQMKELLIEVYRDLGFEVDDKVSLKLLYEHPVMRDLMEACENYTKKDISTVFMTE